MSQDDCNATKGRLKRYNQIGLDFHNASTAMHLFLSHILSNTDCTNLRADSASREACLRTRMCAKPPDQTNVRLRILTTHSSYLKHLRRSTRPLLISKIPPRRCEPPFVNQRWKEASRNPAWLFAEGRIKLCFGVLSCVTVEMCAE